MCLCVGIDLSFSIAMVLLYEAFWILQLGTQTLTRTDRMAVRNVNDKVSYNSMANNVEHICGMRLDKDRSHKMKRMMAAMMKMKNDNETATTMMMAAAVATATAFVSKAMHPPKLSLK